MRALHTAMMEPSQDFDAQFEANARLLRQVAGQLAEIVVEDKSQIFTDDDVMRQVQAWQRDPLLRELRMAYRRDQPDNPLSRDWLVTGSSALQTI
jgi:hypothetical protein